MKEEIEEQAIEQRLKNVKNIFTRKEMIKIENELKRSIYKIIFDSSENDWFINKSDFYKMIKNKSNLIMIIETTKQMKFGCYIESEINKQYEYIKDKNAFLFELQDDLIIKYPILNESKTVLVCEDSEEDLIVFGNNENFFSSTGDIVIKKKDSKKNCSCLQKSFTNSNKNSVLGKLNSFEIDKIIVISTKNYEETIKQQERFTKHKLRNWLLFNEFCLLEEWSSLQCHDVVFDTNVDCWDSETSEFNKRIIGKKQLMFIIENEREKFGYYFNTEVKEKYFLNEDANQSTDSKSFEFSLQSDINELKEPIKVEINNTEHSGILLFDNSNHELVRLGDIHLFKLSFKNQSFINQNDNNFHYNGFGNVLCGRRTNKNTNFKPKRIVVIQMK